MFVSIPTRHHKHLRWATPLLFALLWGAYLWASTRPEDARRLWLLDWGALTGGEAIGNTFQALWLQGHWQRLFSALFLHADWAHLLGNLVFLLIFGLPAERVMGAGRFLVLFLTDGGGFVTPETIAHLTTPPEGAEYALGWAVAANSPLTGGPMLAHEGSNTRWHVTTIVAPARGLAAVAASNDHGRGGPATQGLAFRLIRPEP